MRCEDCNKFTVIKRVCSSCEIERERKRRISRTSSIRNSHIMNDPINTATGYGAYEYDSSGSSSNSSSDSGSSGSSYGSSSSSSDSGSTCSSSSSSSDSGSSF